MRQASKRITPRQLLAILAKAKKGLKSKTKITDSEIIATKQNVDKANKDTVAIAYLVLEELESVFARVLEE